MKSFLPHKSFIKATVKISGCLIIIFMISLKVDSQSLQQDNDHYLDSLAGQQYKFFRESNVKGNLDKALEYLDNYAILSDSVIKIQRVKQLSEINAHYENEKKEQEVSLLIQENKLKDLQINKNRFLIFGISGVALLVWLIIAMVIRQGRLRANQKSLALEQTLLRSQMNPHFIFNTLTNIQSLILRDDPSLSIKYLDNFSTLIGTILASSGEKLITLETELTTVTNYFKLQQLRFGDMIDFEIVVGPGLDTNIVMLPPLMVQPLIENAIEHGIKPKQGKGRVMVRFQISVSGLRIEVEDDGVGRNYRKAQPRIEGSHHAGLALVILKERLESMNKGRSMKNKMEIVDLYDDENRPAGTLVKLDLAL
jgi:LytS/YehU family sensor histidine kinase